MSKRLICPQCGAALIAGAPEVFERYVNVEWSCPTHGRQITVSTRTDR